MMARRIVVMAAAVWASQGAMAMCYEVYAGERLVYRATQAPVSLALPLSQTVPARFGNGAVLRFFPDESGCTLGAGDSPIAVAAAELGGSGNEAGPARSLSRFFRDRENVGPAGSEPTQFASDTGAPIDLPPTAAGRRKVDAPAVKRVRGSR